MIPTDVQSTFDLAGAVPVFVPDLNREAWLVGGNVLVGGRRAVIVDALVTPERLAVIADEVLANVASEECAR